MGLSDAGDKIPGLDDAVPVQLPLDTWGDAAMHWAAPITKGDKVHLLWMTEDPLGAVAAACRMYEGKPTYTLKTITNAERRHYWEQIQKTHLKAPLEFVKMHFFIENVDRAFTHQMVRQRTAVYAQESLRFSVKENLSREVARPDSLFEFEEEEVCQKAVDVWDDAIDQIEASYLYLIGIGVPAEDARGLLPQATPTRIHYCTDLRALMDHAGNRLCTQAQFHWREVFLQIRKAIQEYPSDHPWQFEYIAQDAFAPVCYELGRCGFKASFDRGCSIRQRVDVFAENGIPSEEWGVPPEQFLPILASDWASDPEAGRTR